MKTLGAGGGSGSRSAGSSYIKTQTVPTLEDGLSAGYGVCDYGQVNTIGISATSPGSGGGGACLTYNASWTGTAQSGAGADGAVEIYTRKASV